MLSVIVPVKNAQEFIEHQLEALESQVLDEPFEIVVADNGSTDASKDIVARWERNSSRLRLVDASEKPGPSAARNAGVKEALGNRLAFCDADDVVAPGWLRALDSGLDRADCVVGAIESGSLNGRPAEPARDPWPPHFRSFLRAGLSANMALHRAAFEQMGGFAPFTYAGEDVDLCWRLLLAGYRLEFEPSAVVSKRDPQRLGQRARKYLRYGRGDVELYARFCAAGMPRDLASAFKAWGWLVLAAPGLFDARIRRQWCEVICIRAGRVIGSFEQRTLYL